MGDLGDVTAVISGSSRGLGLAFARHLAARGAGVVLNGRDPATLEAAVAELVAGGGRVTGVAGSVADEAVADELVAVAEREHGGVTLVVNNAGITRDRTLLKMSAEDFDAVIATHVRGAWALSRAGAAAMVAAGRPGQIVNVVSGSALFGLVGQSNYAAAKGALLGFTRALTVELARHGVRVNALYPVALTDMTRPVVELAESRGRADDAPPFGNADEVAPMLGFLASPAGAHVAGQVIHFDGRAAALWSHPEVIADEERGRPWTADELAAFFERPPAPLHPDRWGTGTRRLGPSAPS